MDRKYANYATSHHWLIDLEVILSLICYLAYLSDYDVTDLFFLMWKKKNLESLCFQPFSLFSFGLTTQM